MTEAISAIKFPTQKYTVALQIGGIMEQPHFTYENYQVIEATSEKEATDIYNKRNNCSYFYGTVMGVNGNIDKHDQPAKHNSFC